MTGQGVLAGQNGRNADFNILELNEDQTITGLDILSGSITLHGAFTVRLDYNRTLLGDFLGLDTVTSFTQRDRIIRVRNPVTIMVQSSPTDRHVGRHVVTTTGTTAGGESSTTNIILVTNMNDPTSAAAGTLTSNSGWRVTLPLFNLTDEDFEIPPRAAAIRSRGGITLTSWLNLTFTRNTQGSAQTQFCVLPRRERFIAGTLTDDQFRPSTRLTFNLLGTPACAALYRAAEEDGADNLTLTSVQLLNYTEPSGGPEQVDDHLVIASGHLNITLNDAEGDGIPDALDPDDDNNGFFEIRTAEDLDAVRANLNASYELTRSINLTAYPNWQPLGNALIALSGTLRRSRPYHRTAQYQPERDEQS